ncbi:sunset domain-containing protein [Crossiella sp. CA198]|uniref:sunset domain-containing protein n=1 Tax=Crossiella sp. CA198 TaxID=3455607 RepID=UPI003F8D09F4
MMWLFWQVFLLCLAAFLIGGLVSWLLLVRPLAERRAAAAVTEPVPAAPPEPVAAPEPPLSLAEQEIPAQVIPEPAQATVKGNTRTKRYHTPESPYFNRTKGDIWFASVAEAEQAGYTAGVARRRAEAVR